MISVIAGILVAILAYCAALYKRRTGWHWVLLALAAFAILWLTTGAALFIAGVPQSFAGADKHLGGFAGGLTAAIILVILAAVPFRPRRRPIDVDRKQRAP